jgi:putative transposase
MKTSRCSDPQILAILRQAEGDVAVAELCREHGMTPLPGRLLRSKRREGARPFISGGRSMAAWMRP